jgi:hypothetical protein
MQYAGEKPESATRRTIPPLDRALSKNRLVTSGTGSLRPRRRKWPGVLPGEQNPRECGSRYPTSWREALRQAVCQIRLARRAARGFVRGRIAGHSITIPDTPGAVSETTPVFYAFSCSEPPGSKSRPSTCERAVAGRNLDEAAKVPPSSNFTTMCSERFHCAKPHDSMRPPHKNRTLRPLSRKITVRKYVREFRHIRRQAPPQPSAQ